LNIVVVEILIRAHDCYTAALNMEGIAAVLHHAHVLTTKLLQKQKWALMVRTYLMYISIYCTYYAMHICSESS